VKPANPVKLLGGNDWVTVGELRAFLAGLDDDLSITLMVDNRSDGQLWGITVVEWAGIPARTVLLRGGVKSAWIRNVG
jgi:hypothetical protein